MLISGCPYHVYCAEHMAVVVAGLQVLSDVGKRAQVFWILGCTRNVTDLMLCDDVLHREERLGKVTINNVWSFYLVLSSQHKENIKLVIQNVNAISEKI